MPVYPSSFRIKLQCSGLKANHDVRIEIFFKINRQKEFKVLRSKSCGKSQDQDVTVQEIHNEEDLLILEPHMIFLAVLLGALFVAILISSVVAGVRVKRRKKLDDRQNIIGGAFKASSVNLEQFPPLIPAREEFVGYSGPPPLGKMNIYAISFPFGFGEPRCFNFY